MIEIKNVTKKYGSLKALDSVNITVKSGEIYGFIGPNGAGKTTAIRVISTLIRDFTGTVTVNGMDVKNDYKEVRKIIGYMPDFVGAYKKLTVYEYLEFFGRAYKIPKLKLKKSINDCLEITELTEKRDEPAAALSRGVTQRLILAKTLIHGPALLLLDEPASGLDPRARVKFKEIIKELAASDKTIFISSHILTELSDICSSIGIIERGKIIASGAIGEIKQLISKNRLYKIKRLGEFTDGEISAVQNFENILTIDKKSSSEIVIEYTGPEKNIPQLLNFLCLKNIPVIEFSEIENNLEDVFMKITEGGIS